jgi:hypothetical protein
MRSSLNAIRVDVEKVLRRAGFAWVVAEQRASQIVLFGSRAVGVADEGSDWDLLFVGEGEAMHTQEVDIVWIRSAMIRSERWLGSELASHVAVYGRWLLGPDDWRHDARISPDAARRKRAAIEFQLLELQKVWDWLLPGAQARHIRRLRRDVQRLELLSSGIAVPPSRHLDAAWVQRESPREDLAALFAAIEINIAARPTCQVAWLSRRPGNP